MIINLGSRLIRGVRHQSVVVKKGVSGRSTSTLLNFSAIGCSIKNHSKLKEITTSVTQPALQVSPMDSLQMSSEEPEDHSDLFSGAMPKEEIGALRFLKEHPEFDGRGVIIAILDTGVDPGAAGLQYTSQGKPKVLDVIDCTGSGDVDMSSVVKADADGFIEGASGRKLKLHTDWTNPSGEWRVGIKHVYQLFSRGLVDRVKSERRKQWDEQQRVAVAQAVADLAGLEGKSDMKASGDAAKLKAELESRLSYLKEAAKSYEDFGPLIDCVVWHDGHCWRAALDTSELHTLALGSKKAGGNGGTGALSEFTPLTDFKAERKYSTFSFLDSCNFAVNIYGNGAVLSIVVDAGAHGTHVAGITAAHFEEDTGMNGIAPGAQIISCKIGDTRLGSMETGTGLTRAMIAVLSHKCDLINMSYGEPTSTPNSGRYAGPALSTVGAPGGTSAGLYGIGAYVSPQLAEAGHSVRESSGAGRQYTWSSRGPSPDGHVGVAFSAPGGAIAPVPQWTLQKRQLMNGTSMSSPNACGGIALILSGLKQQQQLQLENGATETAMDKSLPVKLRRALEATCLPLGGGAPDAVLTYGRGLIQIDSAFEYMQRCKEAESLGIRYDIAVSPSGGSSSKGLPPPRGVYLRQAHETRQPVSYSVTVTPLLHQDVANEARLSVEDRLVLEPATPEWVSCPASLLLHHSGRGFEVNIDATRLPNGLHYSEIMAYDATAKWRGPLFRVPITVIKPVKVPQQLEAVEASVSFLPAAPALPNLSMGPLHFNPGTEHRQFMEVPEGASWAEITLTAGNHDTPKIFLLRATQLQPHLSYKRTESSRQATLSAGSEFIWTLPVVPGCTVEVTLAQFWSSLGSSSLSATIEFHGVVADGAGGSGEPGVGMTLDGSAGTKRFVVKAPLRNEKVKPEAKLSALQWGLRPFETSLSSFSTSRDTLPEGRVLYRLILSYKLNVAEAGKHLVSLPSINKHVYDGALEAQMTMIYDSHKRLIQVGDVYPEYTQLKKGDYTVRLMLRHDSQDMLDKLTNLPLVVRRRLESAVQLPVYTSKREAMSGGAPMSSEFLLRRGDSQALFLGPLPDDKVPKDASLGRTLVGKLTLGQLHNGSGAAPAGLSLVFIAPPAKASSDKNASVASQSSPEGGADKADSSGTEGVKNPAEEALNTALRDAKIKFLKDMKLGGKGPEADQNQAVYDAILSELKSAYPKHLPLLQEHLKKMDSLESSQRNTVAGLTAVILASDEVISSVDKQEIACVLAIKCPEDTPEAKKAKKDNEERRSALVDALQRKCIALLELEQVSMAPVDDSPPVDMPAIAVDANEDKQQGLADGSLVGGSDATAGTAGIHAHVVQQGKEDEFKVAFTQLREWVDTATDVQYALLHAKAELKAKRFVCSLQAIDKGLSEDSVKSNHKELQELKMQVLTTLGWDHLKRAEEEAMHVKFPKAFQPF
ncbi:hypothetical protein CEUSTIGMA_g10175.t1 [Chlamydomonas eustigma]|uniref:tripeptidyl-peptidase II n=1 Tax=Chlamydomonas eustigma TaxID=1157962 RepID=A0A250XIK6_9CHLO|nr:hypothetical protein CEUSTIGMA_g10175.t1 [Chlamydomonas eustigma]|eukprot:GAX82749.1 hypothetical protein CEUSTIGMA_g10175.t1 [Chlamydomonas eustigma]